MKHYRLPRLGNIGVGPDEEGEAAHDNHVKPSPVFFDPWLVCDHPRIEALTREAVEDGERRLAARRRRKRRDVDRQNFLRVALALVSNAAYAHAKGYPHRSIPFPEMAAH
jgi:hypothetical protein